MHHVAIMNKRLGFLEKIQTGEKTIESRWLNTQRTPYRNVQTGDTLFFKNTSELVSIKAKVNKVLEFENLSPYKINDIIKKYGKDIGIHKKEIQKFFLTVQNKKYCVLIFIKNPLVIKPFHIDKRGYGMQSAWISVKNINQIKTKKI